MLSELDTLITYHDTLFVETTSLIADGLVTPAMEWSLYVCLAALAISLVLFRLHKKRNRKEMERIEQERQLDAAISDARMQESQMAYDRLALSYLQNSAIYRELKEVVGKHKNDVNNTPLLSAAQLQSLQEEINHLHNDFVLRLKAVFPELNPDEVGFCSLVKAGFKYSEIACLLGRTPNMMYKRRKAITEKFQTSQGDIETLETFLSSF